MVGLQIESKLFFCKLTKQQREPKMKKTAFITILSAIILAGCSSNKSVEDYTSEVNCTFPDSPTTEAPKWVCDVIPSDVAFGAVGYAKKSVAGYSVMHTVAMQDGRTKLAKQLNAKINSTVDRQDVVKETASSTGDALEESQKTTTIHSSSDVKLALTNSRSLVLTHSPAGGLYILVGMDKASYEANVNNVNQAQ